MRDHFERPLRDGTGLLLVGSSVRLLEPGTTTPLVESIYVGPTGIDEHTNPWITDTGVIDFYLKRSRMLRIGVTSTVGSPEVFFEDIEVGNVDLARETLAFSIAGPLSVQVGSLPLYIDADGEIERIRASVGIASVGADIQVDVNLHSGSTVTSLFGAGPVLTIPAGETTAFIDLPAPIVVASTDFLTVDVDQVGTTTTGSHMTVQTRMARY